MGAVVFRRLGQVNSQKYRGCSVFDRSRFAIFAETDRRVFFVKKYRDCFVLSCPGVLLYVPDFLVRPIFTRSFIFARRRFFVCAGGVRFRQPYGIFSAHRFTRTAQRVFFAGAVCPSGYECRSRKITCGRAFLSGS